MPTIKVAVADDHGLFRNGICDIINSFRSCRVIMQASEGAELIHQLSGTDTLPDICMIDLNMPVLNGYDTLTEIKKTLPLMKVIIVTMHTEAFALQKIAQLGADGYVVKNMNPKELEAAIKSVFKNSFYFYDPETKAPIDKTEIKQPPRVNSREMEFLKLCGQPLGYDEIAAIMNVSTRTVEGYQYDLTNKLKINNRLGLALFAKNIGLA